MKKTVPTITVGIPAYNEAGNIGQLLSALLEQDLTGFRLERIIIVSDGSTDATERVVRAVADRRVTLVRNPRRMGQALTQNVILSRAKGDILVLLNADTLPENRHTIRRLAETVVTGTDYAIAKALPVPARTFFEEIINQSIYLRTAIFERFPGYDTSYLCGGRGRAMSRKLYRRLRWPKVFTEDVYAYLYCKKNGFSTRYRPDAVMLFRSPDNWADHRKQSGRFRAGPEELTEYFGAATIAAAFSLPAGVMLPALVSYTVRHPFWMLAYAAVHLLTKITAPPQSSATWSVSASSKGLAI